MRTFTLTDEQADRAAQWVRAHACPTEDVGAIGGRFTYHFTPTGLGPIERVSCACGAEINLTDFDSW